MVGGPSGASPTGIWPIVVGGTAPLGRPTITFHPTDHVSNPDSMGVLMGKARSQAEVPDKQRINEKIRTPQVRVIGAEGDQLGILPISEALAAAREAGLDLVEVAPTEKPPVCRIMDYGKYKYQQKKRQHRTPHAPDEGQGNPRATEDGQTRHRGEGQPGPRVPRTQGQGARDGDVPRPRDGPRGGRPAR